MSPLTILLMQIAFFFAVGIVILKWTRPKKELLPSIVSTRLQPMPTTVFRTNASEYAATLEARLKAVEQKTQMAHARIHRLEEILTKIPLAELEKHLDLAELQKKVNRLVDFKNEIRIHVAALEEKQKQFLPANQSEAKQLNALERELKKQDQSLRELETKIPQLVFNQKKQKK